MRRSWVCLAFGLMILLLAPSGAPAQEPYQEVRLPITSPDDLHRLLANPQLELMGLGDGEVRLLSRPSTTRALRERGLPIEVLHENLEEFYSSRQAKTDGYGVWHTYEETLEELGDLHDRYPEITSAPFSIGQSGEGRDLWAITISDHPERDEGEPEVLIDGVHHAREIMSLETCLYVARTLCESYDSDPYVKSLVDGRQVTFVPIVNPDGFVYNEERFPGGGGMWRKNRRDNGSACWGVDLNRNYPYMWGLPGASSSPCADDYRGPGAASEPETQAMIRLLSGHSFVTQESIHSVAGMILFPWGYTTDPTPDDAILRSIAALRNSRNGYLTGQAPELLYLVSGGMGDWAYGEQEAKPKIFCFTTEIGGSGFWPDPSEREPLLEENLSSMLDLIDVAGPSVEAVGLSVLGADGNGRLDAGETTDLVARIVNDGLAADALEVRMHLRCDDPYVLLLGAADSIGTVSPGATAGNDAHPFRCRVEEGCPQGRQLPFTLVVEAAGSLRIDAPFVLRVGDLPAIVGNDFEEPGDEWLTDDTQTTPTGAFVRVDPNPTPEQPGDDTTPDPGIAAWITGQNMTESEDDVDQGVVASRSPDFDLSAFPRVRLSMRYFHGQRDGGDDPDGDWFAIDVSPDGGESWVNLVAVHDQASAPTWKNLTVDLGDLIPLTDRVRFRVQASDGPAESDIIEGGIDDFFLLRDAAGSAPPGVPVAWDPPDGAAGLPARVTLTVRNAEDPEGDPLRYGFRIFDDPDLTHLVASGEGVDEGADSVTSWSPGHPLKPGSYYWRAYAADPGQRGLYGATAAFSITAPTDMAEREQVRAEPNPARSATRIAFFHAGEVRSRVAVYDPQGRLVRALPPIPPASGWQVVAWDGRDEEGRRVPSGSYWIRVISAQETRTARVVWIE
jgi:carboxypeptidase T